MKTYSLTEAADLTGMSIKAMRGRADRGSIRVVQRDGVRRVPESELERAGLLPDAELRALQAENDRLRKQLSEYKQLSEGEASARRAAEELLLEARVKVRQEEEKARLLADQAAADTERRLEEERRRVVTLSWRERRRLRKEVTTT